MESLAYIITNKFVLVGFDGNLQLSMDGLSLKLNQVNKAHKTNDTTIVSIIGNLKKMTKLYRYVLELSKVNKEITPAQLIDDIKDIFPKGIENLTHFVSQMTEIAQSINDKEITDIERTILLQKLQNNEDIKDLIGENLNPQNVKSNLNYVFVFNYNPIDGINVTSANVAGSFVFETTVPINKSNIPKNSFFVGLVSSTNNENQIIGLRQKYLDILKPVFETNSWEDKPFSEEMIKSCKDILIDALVEITPFDQKPEVFFYELGEHTDYKVLIPTTKLREININDAE